MNKHFIIGNVGNQPEIVKTESTTIANFSIASNRFYKDKNGEKQQETDWLRCVAFGQRAELIEKFVDSGSKISIIGRVQTRKYEDKNGETRFTTETIVDEIEFLSSQKEQPGGRNSHPGPESQEKKIEAVEPENVEEQDDDLPF